MTDPFDDRFRPLRDLDAPDRWEDVERRASAPPTRGRADRRPPARLPLQLGAAAAALLIVLGILVFNRDDDTSSTLDAADLAESAAQPSGPEAVIVEPVVTCPTAAVVPSSLPRGVVVDTSNGFPGLGGSTGMYYKWEQAGLDITLFVGSLGRDNEYVPPDGSEALGDPLRYVSRMSELVVVEGSTGRPYRCERYQLEVIGGGEEARSLAVAISAALRFIDPADLPAMRAGEGSVFVSPDGPHDDDVEVTVLVPRGLAADWHNDGPRWCSIVEGVESCDPTWDGGVYAGIGTSESGFTKKVVLRRWVFTPTGWRDCAEEAVTCRFLVARDGGGFAASDRIRFQRTQSPGPVPMELRPARIAGSAEVTVTAPVQPDPSWSSFDQENPERTGDYPAFAVSVCAFVDQHSYDCDFSSGGASIVGGSDGIQAQVMVAREFFGFRGWHDCAEEACFVLIRAHTVQSSTAESIVGVDPPVAAAPLRVDPEVPAPPRPTITIVEPPPYERDQRINVRVEHVPSGGSFQVAVCHQDPQVVNDCGYYEIDVRVPTTEAVIELFPDYHSEACAAGRCYLALMPGQEGAGPVATAPLELVGGTGG